MCATPRDLFHIYLGLDVCACRPPCQDNAVLRVHHTTSSTLLGYRRETDPVLGFCKYVCGVSVLHRSATPKNLKRCVFTEIVRLHVNLLLPTTAPYSSRNTPKTRELSALYFVLYFPHKSGFRAHSFQSFWFYLLCFRSAFLQFFWRKKT